MCTGTRTEVLSGCHLVVCSLDRGLGLPVASGKILTCAATTCRPSLAPSGCDLPHNGCVQLPGEDLPATHLQAAAERVCKSGGGRAGKLVQEGSRGAAEVCSTCRQMHREELEKGHHAWRSAVDTGAEHCCQMTETAATQHEEDCCWLRHCEAVDSTASSCLQAGVLGLLSRWPWLHARASAL